MRAITTSRAEGLTIGKLSQLTGVNVETIRYYEKIKVLPAPLRTENGRRVYGPLKTRIPAFIRHSRELGFSPDEIRALLRLGGAEKASCRAVPEIAAHITSMTSARRSATFARRNACLRKRSPNAPARPRGSARCWTFSISGASS